MCVLFASCLRPFKREVLPSLLFARFKLHADPSDEETWIKLPDDSILSYDIYASITHTRFEAQRFIPSKDQWVDVGYELGPSAHVLPNAVLDRVGSNGFTGDHAGVAEGGAIDSTIAP